MVNGIYTNRWPSVRLSSLFFENKDRNSDFQESSAYQFCFGTLIRKKQYDMTEDLIETYKKYAVVKPGDIIINGLNLNYDFVTQRVAIAKEKGIITSAYISIRPRNKQNNAYYCYLLKAMDGQKMLHSMGTGIRLTLSFANLKDILLPVPPRDEQDQIVRFLDWKVSEINKLINIKHREIKNIDALKRNLVSHVVTRGLVPDVALKDSGVKWLGDIPAHWNTIKLRQILHPVSIKNHPELPLLSVVRERGVIIRDVDDKESNHNYVPDDLSGYKMVKKGQFAMNKMKAWQGSYGVSDYTGIVSPAYFIFDIDFDNLKYFHYAIRSKVYVNFFAQASDGIRVGQWDLQMDKMKEIPFIVPPADEQIQIVEYIESALPKYDDAICVLREEIRGLEELKTKLISDVVTGKIDVRDVVIPDYEYVDEEIDTAETDDSEENTEEQEEE